MAQTAADRARFEAEGRTGAVRLKMPREGVCRFFDHIRGEMAVDWVTEQDHVIQRADGSVLYNLASVVDDFDMKITHVIRAQEHLSNTPRQIFIARGLGYHLPEYAHLPFVAEPSGRKKLSKRELDKYLRDTSAPYKDFRRVYEHGKAIAEQLGLPTSPETFSPVVVDFYKEVGYLPEAVLNALLLVGWSLDDKTEMFDRVAMTALFSLERVNKAQAAFDAGKLWAFQGRYMERLPLETKVDMALDYVRRARLFFPQGATARERNDPELLSARLAQVRPVVEQVVEAAGPRFVVAGDVLDYPEFFVPDEQIAYDDKAFDKNVRQEPGRSLLPRVRARLAESAFDVASLERLANDLAQAEGVDVRCIVQPVRVAVTGKSVGFGTYETLAILGKERCLARIARALGRLSGG
jgi:glutamyl-tRNA synthetase